MAEDNQDRIDIINLRIRQLETDVTAYLIRAEQVRGQIRYYQEKLKELEVVDGTPTTAV